MKVCDFLGNPSEEEAEFFALGEYRYANENDAVLRKAVAAYNTVYGVECV